MRDDANIPQVDLALLERTARVLAARRRTDEGYRRVMALWSQAGFCEGSVLRAIDALNVEVGDEYTELQGAQQILEVLRAPVQLELIKMAEARVADRPAQVRQIAYDAGFYARFQGVARSPTIEGRRLTDQVEREAWLAGFDEADELLRA